VPRSTVVALSGGRVLEEFSYVILGLDDFLGKARAFSLRDVSENDEKKRERDIPQP
jgi:hypothetical protein